MFESLEGRRLMAQVVITGTPDADTIIVSINAANPNFMMVKMNGYDTAYAAVTSIAISGGTGNDLITIVPEITVGTIISGNSGHDTIRGGGGADQITGNNGNDVIYGQDGNDTISGNEGGDYLDGQDGNDLLVGGNGPDVVRAGGQSGDVDYIYQNEGGNVDDGYNDDLYATVSSVIFKTNRDDLFYY